MHINYIIARSPTVFRVHLFWHMTLDLRGLLFETLVNFSDILQLLYMTLDMSDCDNVNILGDRSSSTQLSIGLESVSVRIQYS